MILLSLLLATSIVTTPTLTAKTSIEAVATPTVTSEIQKFKEVIQEKVKAKLQEINKSNDTDPKRGYLGTITKIDDQKISLDAKNKKHSVIFNVETSFLNTKSSKIKYTDLKVGQEILAIGLLDNQSNFSAKRIIVTTPKSTQNIKTTIYGQVVDVSTMYSLIAMIPVSNKNTQYQIKTDTKNIQILSKTGEKMTLKYITKGKKIIVISTSAPISGQTLTVEKIIVL